MYAKRQLASRCFRLRKEQKSDDALAGYYRRKAEEKVAQLDETKSADVRALRAEIASLQEDNEILESEKERFCEQLDDALQEVDLLKNELDDLKELNVDEFDFRTGANGRPYSDAFVTCFWELKRHNVADQHIVAVIESVLKLIGKKMVNRPASGTISSISSSRRLSAAQQQLKVATVGL